MPKLRGDLGPLERAVMDVVWQHDDEVTVRQVLESEPGDGHAYTTIMTVLDRLWRKGFVSRRRHGRAYLYRARLSRDDHVEALVKGVLAAAGDRRSAVLGFVRSVDDDDLDALRKAVRQVQRERRDGP